MSTQLIIAAIILEFTIRTIASLQKLFAKNYALIAREAPSSSRECMIGPGEIWRILW